MAEKSERAYGRGLRLTALAVAFVFTVTNVTWTTPAAALPADVPLPGVFSLEELTIPSEIGTITSKYGVGSQEFRGKDELQTPNPEIHTVVLIQDAHAVIDAQENIARILTHLQKRFGVELTALEGAKGRLEPIVLRTFPEQEVRSRILAGYEQRAELSGPEMTSVFQERAGEFRGMEDWKLYQKNYAAYLEAQARKDPLMTQWNAFKQSLDTERSKVYSPGLNEFEEIREGYLFERASLLDLLIYLSQFSELLKNAAGYQELSGVMASIRYEKSGKQEALVPLVRKIADEFKTKYLRGLGVKFEMNFYNRYQAFVTGQIAAGEMLQYLVKLGGESGKRIKLTPALKRLLGHTQLLSEIRGSQLYDELARFLAEVESTLVKTPDERALADKYRRLFLLKSLIGLELSHDEFMGYQKAPEDYLGLLPGSEFRKELTPAVAYYQAALERDQAFLSKIESMMKTSKKNTLAVVAGGFHTQGLERLLKDKGVAYAVVAPRIDSLKGSENYAKVMRGDLSFKESLKTTYYDALMRDAGKKLMAAVPIQDRVRTLKAWRDNLIRELAKEGRLGEAGNFLPYIDELLQQMPDAVTAISAKRSKEDILKLVDKELAAFKNDSLERIWKTFEFQLGVFVDGLKGLVAKKDVTAQSVSVLLESASQAKPAHLPFLQALDNSILKLDVSGPRTGTPVRTEEIPAVEQTPLPKTSTIAKTLTPVETPKPEGRSEARKSEKPGVAESGAVAEKPAKTWRKWATFWLGITVSLAAILFFINGRVHHFKISPVPFFYVVDQQRASSAQAISPKLLSSTLSKAGRLAQNQEWEALEESLSAASLRLKMGGGMDPEGLAGEIPGMLAALRELNVAYGECHDFSARYSIRKFETAVMEGLADAVRQNWALAQDEDVREITQAILFLNRASYGKNDPLLLKYFPRLKDMEIPATFMAINAESLAGRWFEQLKQHDAQRFSQEISTLQPLAEKHTNVPEGRWEYPLIHFLEWGGSPRSFERSLNQLRKVRQEASHVIAPEEIAAVRELKRIPASMVEQIKQSAERYQIPPELLVLSLVQSLDRNYPMSVALNILERRGVLPKGWGYRLSRYVPDLTVGPDYNAFLGGLVGGKTAVGPTKLRSTWVQRYDGFRDSGYDAKGISGAQITLLLLDPADGYKNSLRATAAMWRGAIDQVESYNSKPVSAASQWGKDAKREGESYPFFFDPEWMKNTPDFRSLGHDDWPALIYHPQAEYFLTTWRVEGGIFRLLDLIIRSGILDGKPVTYRPVKTPKHRLPLSPDPFAPDAVKPLLAHQGEAPLYTTGRSETRVGSKVRTIVAAGMLALFIAWTSIASVDSAFAGAPGAGMKGAVRFEVMASLPANVKSFLIRGWDRRAIFEKAERVEAQLDDAGIEATKKKVSEDLMRIISTVYAEYSEDEQIAMHNLAMYIIQVESGFQNVVQQVSEKTRGGKKELKPVLVAMHLPQVELTTVLDNVFRYLASPSRSKIFAAEYKFVDDYFKRSLSITLPELIRSARLTGPEAFRYALARAMLDDSFAYINLCIKLHQIKLQEGISFIDSIGKGKEANFYGYYRARGTRETVLIRNAYHISDYLKPINVGDENGFHVEEGVSPSPIAKGLELSASYEKVNEVQKPAVAESKQVSPETLPTPKKEKVSVKQPAAEITSSKTAVVEKSPVVREPAAAQEISDAAKSPEVLTPEKPASYVKAWQWFILGFLIGIPLTIFSVIWLLERLPSRKSSVRARRGYGETSYSVTRSQRRAVSASRTSRIVDVSYAPGNTGGALGSVKRLMRRISKRFARQGYRTPKNQNVSRRGGRSEVRSGPLTDAMARRSEMRRSDRDQPSLAGWRKSVAIGLVTLSFSGVWSLYDSFSSLAMSATTQESVPVSLTSGQHLESTRKFLTGRGVSSRVIVAQAKAIEEKLKELGPEKSREMVSEDLVRMIQAVRGDFSAKDQDALHNILMHLFMVESEFRFVIQRNSKGKPALIGGVGLGQVGYRTLVNILLSYFKNEVQPGHPEYANYQKEMDFVTGCFGLSSREELMELLRDLNAFYEKPKNKAALHRNLVSFLFRSGLRSEAFSLLQFAAMVKLLQGVPSDKNLSEFVYDPAGNAQDAQNRNLLELYAGHYIGNWGQSNIAFKKLQKNYEAISQDLRDSRDEDLTGLSDDEAGIEEAPMSEVALVEITEAKPEPEVSTGGWMTLGGVAIAFGLFLVGVRIGVWKALFGRTTASPRREEPGQASVDSKDRRSEVRMQDSQVIKSFWRTIGIKRHHYLVLTPLVFVAGFGGMGLLVAFLTKEFILIFPSALLLVDGITLGLFWKSHWIRPSDLSAQDRFLRTFRMMRVVNIALAVIVDMIFIFYFLEHGTVFAGMLFGWQIANAREHYVRGPAVFGSAKEGIVGAELSRMERKIDSRKSVGRSLLAQASNRRSEMREGQAITNSRGESFDMVFYLAQEAAIGELQDPRNWRKHEQDVVRSAYAESLSKMDRTELGNELQRLFSYQIPELGSMIPINDLALLELKGETFLQGFLDHLSERGALDHYIGYADIPKMFRDLLQSQSDWSDIQLEWDKFAMALREVALRWSDVAFDPRVGRVEDVKRFGLSSDQLGELAIKLDKLSSSCYTQPGQKGMSLEEWQKILNDPDRSVYILRGFSGHIVGAAVVGPAFTLDGEKGIWLDRLMSREDNVRGKGAFILDVFLSRMFQEGITIFRWYASQFSEDFYLDDEKGYLKPREDAGMLARLAHDYSRSVTPEAEIEIKVKADPLDQKFEALKTFWGPRRSEMRFSIPEGVTPITEHPLLGKVFDAKDWLERDPEQLDVVAGQLFNLERLRLPFEVKRWGTDPDFWKKVLQDSTQCVYMLIDDSGDLVGAVRGRFPLEERRIYLERIMTVKDNMLGRGTYLLDFFLDTMYAGYPTEFEWTATPDSEEFYDRFLADRQAEGILTFEKDNLTYTVYLTKRPLAPEFDQLRSFVGNVKRGRSEMRLEIPKGTPVVAQDDRIGTVVNAKAWLDRDSTQLKRLAKMLYNLELSRGFAKGDTKEEREAAIAEWEEQLRELPADVFVLVRSNGDVGGLVRASDIVVDGEKGVEMELLLTSPKGASGTGTFLFFAFLSYLWERDVRLVRWNTTYNADLKFYNKRLEYWQSLNILTFEREKLSYAVRLSEEDPLNKKLSALQVPEGEGRSEVRFKAPDGIPVIEGHPLLGKVFDARDWLYLDPAQLEVVAERLYNLELLRLPWEARRSSVGFWKRVLEDPDEYVYMLVDESGENLLGAVRGRLNEDHIYLERVMSILDDRRGLGSLALASAMHSMFPDSGTEFRWIATLGGKKFFDHFLSVRRSRGILTFNGDNSEYTANLIESPLGPEFPNLRAFWGTRRSEVRFEVPEGVPVLAQDDRFGVKVVSARDWLAVAPDQLRSLEKTLQDSRKNLLLLVDHFGDIAAVAEVDLEDGNKVVLGRLASLDDDIWGKGRFLLDALFSWMLKQGISEFLWRDTSGGDFYEKALQPRQESGILTYARDPGSFYNVTVTLHKDPFVPEFAHLHALRAEDTKFQIPPGVSVVAEYPLGKVVDTRELLKLAPDQLKPLAEKLYYFERPGFVPGKWDMEVSFWEELLEDPALAVYAFIDRDGKMAGAIVPRPTSVKNSKEVWVDHWMSRRDVNQADFDDCALDLLFNLGARRIEGFIPDSSDGVKPWEARQRANILQFKKGANQYVIDLAKSPFDSEFNELRKGWAAQRSEARFEIPKEAAIGVFPGLGKTVDAKRFDPSQFKQLARRIREVETERYISKMDAEEFEKSVLELEASLRDPSHYVYVLFDPSGGIGGVVRGYLDGEYVRLARLMSSPDKFRGRGSFLLDTFLSEMYRKRKMLISWNFTGLSKGFYDDEEKGFLKPRQELGVLKVISSERKDLEDPRPDIEIKLLTDPLDEKFVGLREFWGSQRSEVRFKIPAGVSVRAEHPLLGKVVDAENLLMADPRQLKPLAEALYDLELARFKWDRTEEGAREWEKILLDPRQYVELLFSPDGELTGATRSYFLSPKGDGMRLDRIMSVKDGIRGRGTLLFHAFFDAVLEAGEAEVEFYSNHDQSQEFYDRSLNALQKADSLTFNLDDTYYRVTLSESPLLSKFEPLRWYLGMPRFTKSAKQGTLLMQRSEVRSSIKDVVADLLPLEYHEILTIDNLPPEAHKEGPQHGDHLQAMLNVLNQPAAHPEIPARYVTILNDPDNRRFFEEFIVNHDLGKSRVEIAEIIEEGNRFRLYPKHEAKSVELMARDPRLAQGLPNRDVLIQAVKLHGALNMIPNAAFGVPSLPDFQKFIELIDPKVNAVEVLRLLIAADFLDTLATKRKDPWMVRVQNVAKAFEAWEAGRSEARIDQNPLIALTGATADQLFQMTRDNDPDVVRSEMRKQGLALLDETGKTIDARIAGVRAKLQEYKNARELIAFILSSEFRELMTDNLGEFGDIGELVSRIRGDVMSGEDRVSLRKSVAKLAGLDLKAVRQMTAFIYEKIRDMPGSGIPMIVNNGNDAQYVLKALREVEIPRLIVLYDDHHRIGRGWDGISRIVQLEKFSERKPANGVVRDILQKNDGDDMMAFMTADLGINQNGMLSVLADLSHEAIPELKELSCAAAMLINRIYAAASPMDRELMKVEPALLGAQLNVRGIAQALSSKNGVLVMDLEKLAEEFLANQSVEQAA